MSQDHLCGPHKAARRDVDSTIGTDPIPTHRVKIEHNLVVKNAGNRTSRQLAIGAMCFHCMGCTADHYEYGVKEEIRNCSAPLCPLYHFRPYKEKPAAREHMPVNDDVLPCQGNDDECTTEKFYPAVD